MKIENSLRAIFNEQHDLYTPLKRDVDNLVQNAKRRRWHYESRIKEEESFAIKMATGRYNPETRLEDFFACTIVVENQASISEAYDLVHKRFTIKYQRPKNLKETHKNPDSFPFDNLRLYVEWKNDPDLPPKSFDNLIFEIQIKTFLQHAWDIATHDLVYKTDDISWPKERIAYQIKAMLEHAELAIYEAETLSKSGSIIQNNSKTIYIQKMIDLLLKYWDKSDLPADLKRLATLSFEWLQKLEISIEDLDVALEREKQNNGGKLNVNLSPYGIIVEVIMREYKDKVTNKLRGARGRMRNQNLVIPYEVNIPDDILDEITDYRILRLQAV